MMKLTYIPFKKKMTMALGVLLLMLVLLLFPQSASAEATRFEEGTVTGQNVNMRLRPSLDSPVVCQIDTGARIGIYCEYEDGWIRVIYGNYRGYIKRDLVFLPSEDSFQANVFGDDLRLRKSPADYGDVVAKLSVGTPLTVEDIEGDWFYISVNGEDTEGYVSKDYVKLSDDEQAAFYLAPGMEGSAVYNMQKELKRRNFFGFPCTGVYGSATKKAVRLFQDMAGIKNQDGIATAETLEILYSDEDIKLEGSQAASSGGMVLMSDWFDVVDAKFKTHVPVQVIDVRTRKSYNVIRYAGTGHADVCPATPEDAAKMLDIYGGKWSWDRRPVWVIINGVMYAASTNGMPHGVDYDPNDGMVGQVCIHFYNSKGHASDAIDPTHQASVEYAYQVSKD